MHEQQTDASGESLAEQIKATNTAIAGAIRRIGGVPSSFYFMEADRSISLRQGYYSLGYAVMNKVTVYLGPNGLEAFNNHPDLQMVNLTAGILSMVDSPVEITPEIMSEIGPKAKESLLEFERHLRPGDQSSRAAKGLVGEFDDIGTQPVVPEYIDAEYEVKREDSPDLPLLN